MPLLQAAVRIYRKRSISRSERESDFRDRVFPFPEIRRINGEVQFTASGIKANKVHFRYRGYSCDEETGFCYL